MSQAVIYDLPEPVPQHSGDNADFSGDDNESLSYHTWEPALRFFLYLVCGLVVFLMACVPCLCCVHINRKRPRDLNGNPVVRTPYSAAVMNRDFTVHVDDDLKCMNCHLIEMGSMACYQELCPQCGNPPPRRGAGAGGGGSQTRF